MAIMPLGRVWTRDEVLALPDDGFRYELVDGELLVSPSPRALHQRVLAALFRLLDPYVRRHATGEVMLSPADLDLRGGQLVQPDLFVTAPVEGRRIREWCEVGIPVLVVEVVSPSTDRYDRLVKRSRYQRSGVPVYWIVDPEERAIEQWTPSDEVPTPFTSHLVWFPAGAAEPLIVDLATFFAEVHAA